MTSQPGQDKIRRLLAVAPHRRLPAKRRGQPYFARASCRGHAVPVRRNDRWRYHEDWPSLIECLQDDLRADSWPSTYPSNTRSGFWLWMGSDYPVLSQRHRSSAVTWNGRVRRDGRASRLRRRRRRSKSLQPEHHRCAYGVGLTAVRDELSFSKIEAGLVSLTGDVGLTRLRLERADLRRRK